MPISSPWVLAARLFEPGYIGGWTAAEHWDLTEQIFRSVCVFTTKPIRKKEQTVVGVPFAVKRVARGAIFGTKSIWRGQVRVAVSDPARTIVDMLADPAVGGGIARQGRILEWVRHVQLHLRHGSFSLWHLLWDCSTGSLDVRAARRRRPAAEWLTPKFRTQVEAASRDFTHTHDRVFSSAARERLYRGAVAFLPYSGDMLPDERLPYLHRPFVEFVLSLEWQHVVRPPEQRWLMRRALGDLMPAVLVNQGAVSPHTAALMEGLRSNWTRMSPLLTGERLAALGVLESRAFRAAIERFKVGDQGTNPQQTKTAMYLELWLATRELPAEAWQADDDLDSDRRTSRVLR